ncbi:MULTISPECIES: DUF86 domain-containing protein [unclassified Meiothermus]|uniref:HepT-like ribonuclease domain-containing protein n=1 Tax=unclassified Meiothermus TaxID=370471 RepID=UPI000D7C7053|nr:MULTISPECIES: HepT-like ribonuclease domain-containing protein [unclassified Meiothermus]PZA07244.1 antitoxin [Meiothermus sp. Pnk-1]RYM37978.1 DUF86 domain-containing protein [Meiothermus sp. PNK-Is4]
MSDRELVRAVIAQILTAIGRIERRAARVTQPSDFVSSDTGLDMLDAIAMMLIAIGENCKNLDKITGGTLLARYPDVDWKGVKGMRDVISHHYFDISPEIVFSVCRKQIPLLRRTFEAMLTDLDS